MNCHLIVPDLFWPAASGAGPLLNLRLPALETILGRGETAKTPGSSLERWLASAFSLPGGLPLAPYALRGDGGEPGDALWAHADPVHLRLHGNRLILADVSQLHIEKGEALDFLATLNAQFAQEDIVFSAPHPGRWYARMPAPSATGVAPTAEVAGRSVDAHLPEGPEGARWRKIVNEAQMLLHAHPRNAAREAAGAMPVNSIWLWGAGKMESPFSPYDAVWSNHPLPAGLALASRAGYHALPASAAPLLKEAAGASILVVADLLPPTAYGNIVAWRDALAAFERDWCAPLLAAVRNGTLQVLALRGLGPDYGYATELKRGDLWQFWRRGRPLDHYVIEG